MEAFCNTLELRRGDVERYTYKQIETQVVFLLVDELKWNRHCGDKLPESVPNDVLTIRISRTRTYASECNFFIVTGPSFSYLRIWRTRSVQSFRKWDVGRRWYPSFYVCDFMSCWKCAYVFLGCSFSWKNVATVV